jgi:hypothetical protein
MLKDFRYRYDMPEKDNNSIGCQNLRNVKERSNVSNKNTADCHQLSIAYSNCSKKKGANSEWEMGQQEIRN